LPNTSASNSLVGLEATDDINDIVRGRLAMALLRILMHALTKSALFEKLTELSKLSKSNTPLFINNRSIQKRLKTNAPHPSHQPQLNTTCVYQHYKLVRHVFNKKQTDTTHQAITN
jgi:hypothetical protein